MLKINYSSSFILCMFRNHNLKLTCIQNQPLFGFKYIIVIHQIILTYVQLCKRVCFSDGSCRNRWVWQCCSCMLALSPSPSPCLPASSPAPSNTILNITKYLRMWSTEQCLASSKILTPHPLSIQRVCSPPAPKVGGYTLTGR